jgi:predicted dehydrogenase
MNRQPPPISRRSFLTRSTYGAAGLLALPSVSAGAVLGANERLGVGVIGCGGRGSHHLGVLSRLAASGAAVEVAAVCDVYRPRLERAAASGARAHASHRELLADPRVDAVCIATPDHHHGAQAIDAVRAGKDVYCEKPLTHWRQDELTARLKREVETSGKVMQVGTQGLSDGAWHQAAALIREGAIGAPVHAECGYFRVGDWGERGMPIDDPGARPGPELDWEAFVGDAPRRDFSVSRFFRWRMYLDYAGGPCTDLFPHSLAPVALMLGVGAPSVAVATGGKFRYEEREVPDTFNLLIDYPQRITVAVLGTQANDWGGTGSRGAGGRSPVIRGWEGTITFEGNEIVVRPLGSGAARRAPVERGESIEEHWRNFLECCRTRSRPFSPVDLGCDVQTALQMGMRSFLDGKVARYDVERGRILL